MLTITYAADDAALAEQIQRDLSGIWLTRDFLLVLATPDSMAEEAVRQAIDSALEAGHIVVPVMVQTAKLPESIIGLRPLDLRHGYKREALVRHLTALDRGKRPQRNRRALVFMGLLALAMFIVGIFGIVSGLVAFPEAEYFNTEETVESQRNNLIRPTLTLLQPNSEQEAQSFPVTLNAAPTLLQPFLEATATALVVATAEAD